MSKFVPLAIGAAEITAGALLAPTTGGASVWLAAHGVAGLGSALIAAGIGTALAGVGTLIAGSKQQGIVTTQRNPTAPWEYGYGRFRTGGTLVYENPWPPPGNGQGGNDQVVDLVIVLPAHSCQSIDALLFDGQRIQIDTTATAPNGNPAPGSGTSFTPVQQTISYGRLNNGIPDGATQIQRVNGVVTVTLLNDIPFLVPGDPIQLSNVPGDLTLNGRFIVAEIISQSPTNITFTFLSGGPNSNVINAGWITTLWADYGRTVYFEPMYGQQELGQTFAGMIYGTPLLGDTGNFTDYISPGSVGSLQGQDTPNPWTASCSLQGKTAVFLRLYYQAQYYKGGIPQISFLMHGKNNILDPRIGTNGTYSVTAASWATNPLVGGLATFTVGTHAIVKGNLISVAGATPTGYNVVQAMVTSITSTTVNCILATNPGSGFSGTVVLTVYIYTENAALCIADFLSIPLEYGGFGALYGATGPGNIPFPQLIAAANTCDAAVSLAAGGTEAAYACNGRFDLDEGRGSILANMLTSCAGRITDVGGQYVIWPAAWVGNSFAIGSNPGGGVVSLPAFMQIAAGPIKWRPTVQLRDLYNGVKGTYMSPANKWLASDFPPYAQDSIHGYTSGPAQYDHDENLAADGGDRRWKDISLRFTVSPSTAQRIAKIELLRLRLFGSGTLVFQLIAYQIVAMDLMLTTIPFLGWSAKQLEVVDDRLRIEPGEEGMGPSMYVELDVKEADPNQYDWNTSEELTAQGYQQPSGDWNFNPVETVPGFTAPYPWKPAAVAPLKGDAYFTGPVVSGTNEGQASFGMQVVYGTDAQGDATANLAISGAQPPNALSAIDAPQITCVGSITGGFLPAGTYFVAGSAFDTGTPVRNSVFSTPQRVTIASGTTGSIAVTVAWPTSSNGGELYMGETETAEGFYFQQSLSASTTTFTITVFDQSTPGAPDVQADHLSAALAPAVHTGVWAQQVQAVTPTTITIGGSGMTTNQWANYVLTLSGKLDPTQPLIILNMPVASNTASAGTPAEFVLTIGPNSNGDQLPDLTTLLGVGDLVTMNGNYTFGPSSFQDPNVANPYFPSGATAVESGHVAIVMTGPDAGDVQTIASVSLDGFGHSTIFELQGTWAIEPNDGDLVIVASAWGPETPGQSFSQPNRGSATPVVVSPTVTNLAKQPWVVIVRMETEGDVSGPDAYAPMRVIYFFGFQGTRTVSGSTIMQAPDKIVIFQGITANATYTCLPFGGNPGVSPALYNQSFLIERRNCGGFTVSVIPGSGSGDTFPNGNPVLTDDVLNSYTDFTIPGPS